VYLCTYVYLWFDPVLGTHDPCTVRDSLTVLSRVPGTQNKQLRVQDFAFMFDSLSGYKEGGDGVDSQGCVSLDSAKPAFGGTGFASLEHTSRFRNRGHACRVLSISNLMFIAPPIR